MDLILELEAQASSSLQAQPGLLELLAFLRAAGVKVREAGRGGWPGQRGCMALPMSVVWCAPGP